MIIKGNVNIWHARYLIGNPVIGSLDPQGGHEPQVEDH